ncbi:MAG: PSD1 domain-containing protein [Verrucomicrobia bacterium]|nr:PSD1 domain-containing protein [Verrucomicrobiota bacterium]
MNPKLSQLIIGLLVASMAPGIAGLTPEQVNQMPPPVPHPVNFTEEIKPIFEARCISCHGRGKSKGSFRMDSRETLLEGGDSGPAIVLGKSTESYLIELVMGFDPDSVMPQKGTKLTREQVGLLRGWIDQGAPWDAGVSFGRLEPINLLARRPELPRATDQSANPVDRFVDSYFAEHKIKSPKPVEDRVFARRVYLDVIGLLPPPEELQRFMADRSQDKRAQLVRRLLADKENYALHWITFWNDMLRNDYRGTGYIDGGRKQITQWLYAALENNLPYDRFVAELINPKPESEGFTKGIVWRGVVNASQTPQMQAAQNISQVFMGVNLKCASCHDSFINDWTLAEAYGLAGIYSEEPLEMVHCDKPTGIVAPLRFIYPQLGDIDPKAAKAERLEQLAKLITQRQDGRLTRTFVNRLWQKFFGRGLIEPVDEMENPAWNVDLLDWLAEEFADQGYDAKKLIELMLTARAYQLPAVPAEELAHDDFVFRGPQVRRMSAEQFRDAIGELTGVWYAKPAPRIIHADGVTNRFAVVRAALVPADELQVALGRPNREQVITVRASAATTLQALELTNGAELASILQSGAEKFLTARNGDSSRTLAEALYQKALSRKPTAKEIGTAEEILGQPAQKAGVEDLLWALTMLPEFQLIY